MRRVDVWRGGDTRRNLVLGLALAVVCACWASSVLSQPTVPTPSPPVASAVPGESAQAVPAPAAVTPTPEEAEQTGIVEPPYVPVSRFDLPRTEKDPDPSKWPWGEPFEIEAKDGMILRGMYKPPRRPQSTVVVFVTGGPDNYVTVFRSLVARIAAKGYGIATYDARGVGLSQRKTDGSTFELFPVMTQREPYRLMIDDAKAVVQALRKSKGVGAFRTVLCGSSVGANVAIMSAADMPLDVRAVIAISPGTNLYGLRPHDAVVALSGRPMLALAAGTDATAYSMIQEIKRKAPEAKALTVGGGAHGHKMLDPERIEMIADWLDEN